MPRLNVLFLAQKETAEGWRGRREAALAGESPHWTPALVDPDRVDVLLPVASLCWAHPRANVTPHVAAVTDPVTAAKFVAAILRRLRASEPLAGLGDRHRG